ncbi:MAG TPA: hypothetical protein VNX68_05810, partial [Nitrosopumilaceae archaeon]|nr:hypothetical protein [Nitrosopumilaceae archaeon]
MTGDIGIAGILSCSDFALGDTILIYKVTAKYPDYIWTSTEEYCCILIAYTSNAGFWTESLYNVAIRNGKRQTIIYGACKVF